MKTIAKALVSVAALVALSAHAEPYVGGSLGVTDYKGPDVGGLSTDRSSTGGKLYGGYEFTPNIAVEGGYANLGKASSAAGDVKGEGVFVDAVGKVPLTESFSALGRVGLFNGKAKSSLGNSDRSTNAKLGLGVQYDFNKQTALRGEWERYRFKAFDTKANVDMYSIGVNHRF
ncbi:MAG TPA: porin family protein [Albitalea sp.]|uniref:porin family protein n=1 Tax=Piscinibacter sp. TaxID=1903157 RepID=UPI002ED124A4